MKRISEALNQIADIADEQRDAAESAREDALEIKLMLRAVLSSLSKIEREIETLDTDLDTHKKSTRAELTLLRKQTSNGSGIHQ